MNDPMEQFEAWLEGKPRLWAWYLKYNFCKGFYADGTEKPDSRIYNLLNKIFYFECPCCSCLRSILFGLIVGWVGAKLL